MIYAPRSSDTGHTQTVIQFRGYKILIAMDDRSRGGDTPLTRSSLIVIKDSEEEVTHRFAGRHNTDNEAINDPEGETLYEVMQAIASEGTRAETPKFYIFSKRVSSAGEMPPRYNQLGILTADSLMDARAKIDLNCTGFNLNASVPFVDFTDGNAIYTLEEISVWDGKFEVAAASRKV
jgi:hypothetical protein